MKEKLLVSACLCGKNTKYNGGNNLISRWKEIEEKFDVYLICPEVMGGLSTPRKPSEQKFGKVFSKDGKDVTNAFLKGAQHALKIALENHIHFALLKESSPSCGVKMIYDGNFCGKKIQGEGVTTKTLKENHIKVFSEEEIEQLLKYIKIKGDIYETNISSFGSRYRK